MIDTSKIKNAISVLNEQIINPEKGLPESVFLFATSITPMINVDLLILDKTGRILLSWRDDEFEGRGWHIPGGIIRLKETFEERIIRTSKSEIGCCVKFEKEPLEIVPIIKNNAKVRCHFITLVYKCSLPDDFDVETNQRFKIGQAGYLKWFDKYPSDMLAVHNFYKKYFYK